MRKKMGIIIALTLMALLCGIVWAQPTPPATPPSPEAMGMQAPQITSSTPVPPASSQPVPTTQAAAMAAAPPTTSAATMTSTYMIAPPGTSTPNQFYVPYYPSTEASCLYKQWVPMWLDIKGYGPLYTYEWYPNGELLKQYMTNIPYPSWRKMWFYGDATGWHILQYYCNGWSNYIYVYVYPITATTSPATAAIGCKTQIIVTSPSIYPQGFSVYVDNNYIGGDGQYGDPLDGYYAFYITGNQQHTIRVSYQGLSYTQTKIYNCGSPYTITLPG